MKFANQLIEECASTNDLARELAEAGFPHGTWVAAKEQGRGRGRLGREWVGERGNLFLSVVLRDLPRDHLTPGCR
jgi:BirA family transcriptional regulator, biotin operon repressor / biotin---[acetyl-CoA-carboxylase] ligase